MSRWKDIYEELIEVGPGVFQGVEPLDEAEHFHVCGHCGQSVDMRQLADVFYHHEPGHKPKPLQ
jgi:hypothetical protein